MVGEVEGYLWMRRRAAAVGGCDKRGGGGDGWGSNVEVEMVCCVSSNGEVVWKSLGSR